MQQLHAHDKSSAELLLSYLTTQKRPGKKIQENAYHSLDCTSGELSIYFRFIYLF